jgi:hypothetical protein
MGEMRYLQLLISILVSLGALAPCFADGVGRNAEKAFLLFESGTASAQKNLTLKRAEIYGFPAARVQTSKEGAICEITVVTMDDKFEISAGQKFELNAYSKDECAGHKHQQDREDCLAKQGRFLRLKLPPRKTGGERSHGSTATAMRTSIVRSTSSRNPSE